MSHSRNSINNDMNACQNEENAGILKKYGQISKKSKLKMVNIDDY